MRVSSFVLALLAVLGTVASGSLECTPAKQAYEEHRGAEIYSADVRGMPRRARRRVQGRSGADLEPSGFPRVGVRRVPARGDRARAERDDDVRVGDRARRAAHRPDVDAVVAFMRGWGSGPRAKLDERTAGGDAARGAATYARECAKCHGAKGTGGPYVGIGGAELLAGASNGFLRHAIRGGRPGTPMAGFASTLGDPGTDDMLSLLRSWQYGTPLTPPPPPAKPPPIPLGPVPLNPKGPEPIGFKAFPPGVAPADLVKAQLDRGARMALLDARAPSDYATEHIPGAVSVPFYDPEPYFASLPKDAWLVCYCACPHAESGQLAQKLAAKGFTKVTVLDEGLGVWRNHNYGTHTGIDP